MKMMEGDWARAWANRSLTRAGPTPTNISMKSEPAMDRKGTFASPAVALAAHSMTPSQTCHGRVSQRQPAHHFAMWRLARRQVLQKVPIVLLLMRWCCTYSIGQAILSSTPC